MEILKRLANDDQLMLDHYDKDPSIALHTNASVSSSAATHPTAHARRQNSSSSSSASNPYAAFIITSGGANSVNRSAENDFNKYHQKPY